MSKSPLYQSLEELHQAFEEFKKTQDQRLEKIEKGQTDPLLDDKIQKIEQTMNACQKKMEKADLALKRPLFSMGLEDSQALHQKAFRDYIAKGLEEELKVMEKKSLNASTKEEGGYVLPEKLANQIYAPLSGYCVMRDLACVVQTNTHQYDLILQKEEAESSWGDKRQETKTPTLNKISIPLHALYAMPQISHTILEDSKIQIEKWLMDEIQRRLVVQENKAFLTGDGQNKPRGLLSYLEEKDTFEVVKTGQNGAFAQENPQNQLIDLVYRLKSQYHPRAHFLMSRSVLSEIRKMKTPEGHYIWQPALNADLKTHTLLGYPVVLCDDMPELSAGKSSVGLAFGDFHETYVIVDRGGICIQRDPYTCKPDVQLLMMKRVGGAVRHFQSLKILSLTE